MPVVGPRPPELGMIVRELTVLVVQPDATVADRAATELADAGIRVAGPVAELKHAVVRAEQQVVAAALVDVALPDSRGSGAAARFRERFPRCPVIVTAPRSAEAEARKAVAEGARFYLLHDEVGRGLIPPLVRDCIEEPKDDAEHAAELRRLLHDLGNILGAASGNFELLIGRLATTDPLAGDIRELHEAVTESVRVFRRFAASWHSKTSVG